MSGKDSAEDIPALMTAMGQRARTAARTLATNPGSQRDTALRAAAAALRARQDAVLAANDTDMTQGRAKGLSDALLDRLALSPERVEAMAAGLETIATLSDPLGAEMARWQRPNGLDIARVRMPLGVIGVIYESRPGVTADAAGLCLKAGNAVILRAGSEALHSAQAILAAVHEGLAAAGLPEDAVQLVPTPDRAAVGALLRLNDYVDVIVPRGGKSLIERVSAESTIPMFKHLEGICHVYVHADADPEVARRVVVNAKMRRPGICGAMETLLVDAAAAETLLPVLVDDLLAAGCAVRGDDRTQAVDARVTPATDADWDTEYLAPIVAVKVVPDLTAAVDHIRAHGSEHTDSIITRDEAAAERFLAEVDSAIVMHNASTQFADGGEFGMGAEIGIATGRLHARGPVGVEQLTTFRYVVRGSGQTRP